jgi:hypothetical protein
MAQCQSGHSLRDECVACFGGTFLLSALRHGPIRIESARSHLPCDTNGRKSSAYSEIGIGVGPGLVCAISREESWNRFSFSWVTSQLRRTNDTWAASRNSERLSTTNLGWKAYERPLTRRLPGRLLLRRGFLASNRPGGSAEFPCKVRQLLYRRKPQDYRMLFTIRTNRARIPS